MADLMSSTSRQRGTGGRRRSLRWAAVLALVLSMSIGGFHCLGLSDIRPPALEDTSVGAEAERRGAQLLADMQDAIGGRERWAEKGTGEFVQSADWYGKPLWLSGWDVNPQRIRAQVILGGDDGRLELLDGPNQGQVWGVRDGKSYVRVGDELRFESHAHHRQKLIYKSYWFQFPFRISEAQIIAHGGQAEVAGERYELVFASWGSAAPNEDFDQFVLYIHPQRQRIEWLHFTVREKMGFADLTARFSDFREVDGFTLPFKQEVFLGKPGEDGMRMHENLYESMRFGVPFKDAALLRAAQPAPNP